MILRTWLGIQQMAKVKTISPEQAGAGRDKKKNNTKQKHSMRTTKPSSFDPSVLCSLARKRYPFFNVVFDSFRKKFPIVSRLGEFDCIKDH